MSKLNDPPSPVNADRLHFGGALLSDLVALRPDVVALDALAASAAEVLAPLPASRAVERAQSLAQLLEERAARLLASLDATLDRYGASAPPK